MGVVGGAMVFELEGGGCRGWFLGFLLVESKVNGVFGVLGGTYLSTAAVTLLRTRELATLSEFILFGMVCDTFSCSTCSSQGTV